MNRVLVIACLALGLLSAAARAEDANRYEVVVVPAAAGGDGKTETLLVDRQTGKTWVRTTEFDPTTFAAKESYWAPQHFKLEPADANQPILPPN